MHEKPLERVHYHWIVRTSLQLDFLATCEKNDWIIWLLGSLHLKAFSVLTSPFDCFDCPFILTCWEEVDLWSLNSLIQKRGLIDKRNWIRGFPFFLITLMCWEEVDLWSLNSLIQKRGLIDKRNWIRGKHLQKFLLLFSFSICGAAWLRGRW